MRARRRGPRSGPRRVAARRSPVPTASLRTCHLPMQRAVAEAATGAVEHPRMRSTPGASTVPGHSSAWAAITCRSSGRELGSAARPLHQCIGGDLLVRCLQSTPKRRVDAKQDVVGVEEQKPVVGIGQRLGEPKSERSLASPRPTLPTDLRANGSSHSPDRTGGVPDGRVVRTRRRAGRPGVEVVSAVNGDECVDGDLAQPRSPSRRAARGSSSYQMRTATSFTESPRAAPGILSPRALTGTRGVPGRV